MLVEIVSSGAAHCQRTQAAQQEVAHSKAGCLAIETHRAAGYEMREGIVECIHNVSTEGKLVSSVNDADIIVELVSVGLVSVVIDRAAISENESADDREHAGPVFRVRTVDLYAHIAIRKELCTDSMSNRSVISEAE